VGAAAKGKPFFKPALAGVVRSMRPFTTKAGRKRAAVHGGIAMTGTSLAAYFGLNRGNPDYHAKSVVEKTFFTLLPVR
jgi:hypothetical protein